MIEIRTAKTEDAGRLLEIYDYYVRNTAITYEYETPSLDEFESRIEKTLKKYPYLVILRDGKIEGYAYAGVFKDRAAYDRSCEISIYIDRSARGCGLGRKLSEALEAELKKMEDAQYRLIEAVLKSLGYKNKVSWETIQKPYKPKGLVYWEQMQQKAVEGQVKMMESVGVFSEKN